MAREIVPGSFLNQIAGSQNRYPAHQVFVWDPNVVTMNQIAAGTVTEPPIDITAYIKTINFLENIGFENADEPSVTQATMTFHRGALSGQTFRRGFIEDGVIVQIRQGDLRVLKDEWVPIFTGTFRGRPGDNPGTPGNVTEGLQAVAFGREERYLNLPVTTDSFPVDTDLGEMAMSVAQRHMGLGQDEILFGATGFQTKHITNQLVEINALEGLAQLFFPSGGKPKFDSRGRLTIADVSLDKPPIRVYASDALIESKIAAPNDVEVNNDITIRGLSAELTRVVQDFQLLTTVSVNTGFFDSEFDERQYYSDDRTQRAQETFLSTIKRIKWSDADWTEIDEFHGRLEIDTKFLRNARVIIFITWLATQVLVAIIDSIFQGGGIATDIIFTILGIGVTLAVIRFALHVLSTAALAALIWAMNFIGRGEYEIHGKPFEFVYQELVSQSRLVGLLREERRTIEFRNDFISDMPTLDSISAARLRRELVKDQLFTLVLMDDPIIEVDDVVETADGSRYYVVSVAKTIQRELNPVMTLTTWKIFDATTAAIESLELAASS